MGIKRYELDEAQWQRIALLLPGKVLDPGRTGSDNRGFCARARTGSTCPSVTANGKRCIAASAGGAMPVYGSGCSRR